jgi:hypothetical protein
MSSWETEEEALEIALEKMRACYLDMEYAMDVDGLAKLDRDMLQV